MTARSGLQIAWYYHLPTICSDDEVADLVDTSLLPLLHVHGETGSKAIIAITGTLLDRIATIQPSALDLFRDLVRRGVLEPGGTCYHEVFPPVVPLSYMQSQLERDLEAKVRHLGAQPTVFYPPNLGWAASLGLLLVDAGYRAVILDEGQFALATSTQLWRWSIDRGVRMASTLQETMIDRRELHRSYVHKVRRSHGRVADGGILTCYFRDVELVKRISFGTVGVLHRPLEETEIATEASTIAELVDSGGLITLADDGDRINPVSLAGYRRFLELITAARTVRSADLEGLDISAAELLHLPSFSVADIWQFWFADLDSLHYLRVLDEVYEAGVPRELEDELLALQDVFFLFWKTVPRKYVYLERLLALWRQVTDPVRPRPTHQSLGKRRSP